MNSPVFPSQGVHYWRPDRIAADLDHLYQENQYLKRVIQSWEEFSRDILPQLEKVQLAICTQAQSTGSDEAMIDRGATVSTQCSPVEGGAETHDWIAYEPLKALQSPPDDDSAESNQRLAAQIARLRSARKRRSRLAVAVHGKAGQATTYKG